MKNILREIVKNKLQEIEEKKMRIPLKELKKMISYKNINRDFIKRLKPPLSGDIGLIAEIKLASPSSGKMGKKDDVIEKALLYQQSGADAISVVVDKKYFNGDLNYITSIEKETTLPILMKDFILDEYQVYEARMIGAEALLIIAKILPVQILKELVSLTKVLGLEPVVEVQNTDELKNVLALNERQKVECIAVNARDLNNFNINIEKACKLMMKIPQDRFVIGFSGVISREEVEKYINAGAKAVLVGTALMKTTNVNLLIKQLKGL